MSPPATATGNVDGTHRPHTKPRLSLAPGEWEAAVAAAVAAVDAEYSAADTDDSEKRDDLVTELVDAQLPGGSVYTLPLPDGAAARVPTWRSRNVWLSVCHAASECERGRAALRRQRIAAATFFRGCAAHAEFAESSTGRRVAVSLKTLVDRSGLSIDQLKRTRRVLKALELGVEQRRGKKLNALERAAAAYLYRSVHGTTTPRIQSGAASVWNLSTPRWALALLPPSPPKRTRPARVRPRRRSRCRVRPNPASTNSTVGTSVPTPAPPGPAMQTARSTSSGCAPQSSGAFFSCGLSVRKDHRARTRAGEDQKSRTQPRNLNLQRAAAELIRRIPAIATVVGDHRADGRPPRSHIGVVCDLLVTAGIDTDRWSGIDIAAALNHHASTTAWTWPSTADITSPLGLVAYRLSLLDWSGISPTETATHGRRYPEETAVTAAYRLIAARRRTVDIEIASERPNEPASAEHRRRMRELFAKRSNHRRTDRNGRSS